MPNQFSINNFAHVRHQPYNRVKIDSATEMVVEVPSRCGLFTWGTGRGRLEQNGKMLEALESALRYSFGDDVVNEVVQTKSIAARSPAVDIDSAFINEVLSSAERLRHRILDNNLSLSVTLDLLYRQARDQKRLPEGRRQGNTVGVEAERTLVDMLRTSGYSNRITDAGFLWNLHDLFCRELEHIHPGNLEESPLPAVILEYIKLIFSRFNNSEAEVYRYLQNILDGDRLCEKAWERIAIPEGMSAAHRRMLYVGVRNIMMSASGKEQEVELDQRSTIELLERYALPLAQFLIDKASRAIKTGLGGQLHLIIDQSVNKFERLINGPLCRFEININCFLAPDVKEFGVDFGKEERRSRFEKLKSFVDDMDKVSLKMEKVVDKVSLKAVFNPNEPYWQGMTLSERQNAVEALAKLYLESYGYNLSNVSFNSDTTAYSPKHKALMINTNSIAANSPLEIFFDIVHEGTHAYHHALVVRDIQGGSTVPERVLERLQYDGKHYLITSDVRGSSNYEEKENHYADNYLEKTAMENEWASSQWLLGSTVTVEDMVEATDDIHEGLAGLFRVRIETKTLIKSLGLIESGECKPEEQIVNLKQVLYSALEIASTDTDQGYLLEAGKAVNDLCSQPQITLETVVGLVNFVSYKADSDHISPYVRLRISLFAEPLVKKAELLFEKESLPNRPLQIKFVKARDILVVCRRHANEALCQEMVSKCDKVIGDRWSMNPQTFSNGWITEMENVARGVKSTADLDPTHGKLNESALNQCWRIHEAIPLDREEQRTGVRQLIDELRGRVGGD